MKTNVLTRAAGIGRVTLAAALVLCVAACNTVEGAGKDVKAAGEGISTAASKTGEAISGESK